MGAVNWFSDKNQKDFRQRNTKNIMWKTGIYIMQNIMVRGGGEWRPGRWEKKIQIKIKGERMKKGEEKRRKNS